MLQEDFLPKFKYAPGDDFPFASFKQQDGREISLKSLKEKWLVLFFYPKDLSPTCTKQACNLRDAFDLLRKHDVALFGLSPDNARRHRSYIEKFQLPFDLIVDEEATIAKALGVYGPKKFMGRVSDAIHRSTFVLDKKRKIHEIIYPVDSARHAEQILRAIGVA